MCSFVSVEYFLFVCCVMVLLIANILLAADVMPVLTSAFVSFSPLSRYLLWLHSALLLFLLAHHFQTSLICFNHLCLFTLNTSHPSLHLLGLLSSLYPSLSVSQLCSPLCGLWRSCSSSAWVKRTAQQVRAHSPISLPPFSQTTITHSLSHIISSLVLEDGMQNVVKNNHRQMFFLFFIILLILSM